jgi:hypothetical protein
MNQIPFSLFFSIEEDIYVKMASSKLVRLDIRIVFYYLMTEVREMYK